MSKLFINALERNEKGKKVRKEGFVPGVIYLERHGQSIPVKFAKNKIEKILGKATKASIIGVKLGDDIKNCVVKDIQRDSLNQSLIHLDMESFKSDDSIRVKVPIEFEGKAMLDNKKLILQTFLTELEVKGQVEKIPELIVVNLSDKKFGDTITLKDIQIDNDIEVLHEDDEIFASISAAQKEIENDDEE